MNIRCWSLFLFPGLRSAWLLAAALVFWPLAAQAEPAFTRSAVNLRAGPSTDYPTVVRLRPGQSLDVVGCTPGYGWCDVVLPDGLRGWVAASLLDYPWGGSPVPLAQYGAAIGVPIVAFSLGSYWSDHYRDRPWYREPRWWGHRPPPPPVAGWRPPRHRPSPGSRGLHGPTGVRRLRPSDRRAGKGDRTAHPSGTARIAHPAGAPGPARPAAGLATTARPAAPAPMERRPASAPARRAAPRPPGWEGRPNPNGSGPPPQGLPPGLPRGTVAPRPHVPLGDRP
ncbi:SH3 domain-containing protein [Xenophilus sp. Marseille-Q4582]|uniref:SH3 domain-containing protein n=1 Tax=Xenophilus sp. Marseille-Q4582 TaxID=2866600 RepID=UPI001CE43579|nr:SH3 domain-containing protein [Xenophilus sp. Marseille-Q4582]